MNVLSIDAEEPWHGEFTRKFDIYRRFDADENIPKVLDLLHEFGTKATFFCVGEAVSFRTLQEIASKGHEIAFHTWDHVPLSEKTEQRFREELAEFKDRVKSLTGHDCVGFRAPSFVKTPWMMSALKSEGYQYDSSVFPVQKLTVYGDSNKAPSLPFTDESGIKEFPLSTCRVLGVNLPMAGGFYLRMWPWWILERMLKTVSVKRPMIAYSHNWELFPPEEMPRTSLAGMFFQRYKLGSAVGKMKNMLEEFEFTSFRQAIQDGLFR